MGTRNLIVVIDQTGKKKVAQYGQFDGYPSGVGFDVLKFLKHRYLFPKFKNNLSKVRFLDAEGVDKEFLESYDKNTPNWSNEPDNRTPEQKRWWETYCDRELAANVLANIANSDDDEMVLLDRTEDSIDWIEWCYVINLQDNTLAVGYKVNEPPIKVWSLDELPDEDTFLLELEPEDEISE